MITKGILTHSKDDHQPLGGVVARDDAPVHHHHVFAVVAVRYAHAFFS